jgi:hypothetical protein
MPDLDCIESALTKTGWNKARVRFFARFLVALIACRTVCLYRLANAVPGEAKTGSHYKRLQRFVGGFGLDFVSLARLVVSVAGVSGPFVLALDRTDWKLGRTPLNVLVLALVHDGVAFPLFWRVLGKAGNSNLAERQAVVNAFLGAFGKERVAYLCADREFGGRAFAAWLQEQGVGFVLRLRGNVQVGNAKGAVRTARGLFWHRRAGEASDLGRRRVFGRPLSLFVSGTRVAGGDFVIVVSDKEDALLERYGKRWGIETLFGCLKRRGFDLEATRLSVPERLCRLIAVLALAFTWAYACGAWLFEQEPWKVKKHGRLMVSLFRKGLDHLQRLLMPLCGNNSQQERQKVIQILSCT